MQKHPDNKNLILATVISFAILLAWAWFYEKPRIDKKEALQQIELANQLKSKSINSSESNENSLSANSQDIINKKNAKIGNAKIGNAAEALDANTFKVREDSLLQSQAQRVKINTKALHGSILLKGAKFDDLTFVDYFEKPYNSQQENKEVILFSPSESKSRYFADF